MCGDRPTIHELIDYDAFCGITPPAAATAPTGEEDLGAGGEAATARRAATKRFQHFITDAPWTAEHVWRRLRATIPDREGVLTLDGTSFPKQGTRSVGVPRQYCGTRGKVANCQVAVTVALWTGAHAWMLRASLYLPTVWLTPDARQRPRIPSTVPLQEKWRLALTLLRQVRTSGIAVTAVLGHAEFGDNATLRRTLHRAKLPYVLGVSWTLTVFPGTRP